MKERIIYQKDNELIVVIPITSIEDVIGQLPTSEYKIEDTNKIPTDRTFRDAWTLSNSHIVIDLDKAKLIAHSRRRIQRDLELKPFDEIISRRIPGINLVKIEAERQRIRDKYFLLQENIDKASNVEEILRIINSPVINWIPFYTKLLSKSFSPILKKIKSNLKDWSEIEQKLSSNTLTLEEASGLFKRASMFLTARQSKTLSKLALDNNINIV